MSNMLVSTPTPRLAKRVVYVGAVGGSAAIIGGLSYWGGLNTSGQITWVIELIVLLAILAFIFTSVSMMIYNRVLLIVGVLAVIVYEVGNTGMTIGAIDNAAFLLKALAVVLAGLLIWAYIQSYNVLKADVQQRTKYIALTVFAVIGSLVSLGAAILVAITILGVRACELSGSSKCL